MQRPDTKQSFSLRRKFGCAFRGAQCGIFGGNNFYIHLSITALVIIAAAVLGVSLVEWCLLALCIAVVLAAEMFNCALEEMAKAVTQEHHESIGNALDISSAAVLIAAVGASVVGATIFVYHFVSLISAWRVQ